MTPIIRPATEQDIPQLLPLMRALAKFEHYLDVFAVNEDILREQGFRNDPPDFHAFVADADGTLVGMLVYLPRSLHRDRQTDAVRQGAVRCRGRAWAAHWGAPDACRCPGSHGAGLRRRSLDGRQLEHVRATFLRAAGGPGESCLDRLRSQWSST